MKNIMFLCTGNSCRSQMAEGFCRKYWGHQFRVFSAGTKMHGMNERAMRVMRESGVDISSQYSKTVDELPPVTFDFVITVLALPLVHGADHTGAAACAQSDGFLGTRRNDAALNAARQHEAVAVRLQGQNRLIHTLQA